MAFVRVETWSADFPSQFGVQPRSRAATALDRLLADGRDAKIRRVAAIILTLAIHLGLIWLILDRLAPGIGTGEGNGHGDGILVMDLSGLQSTDGAQSDAGQASMQPPPTPENSPVEASAPSETFKPEWTVSKLKIANAQPTMAAVTPAVVSGAASVRAGNAGQSAGGGGQGYDPFAGASPQRRDPGATLAGGAKQTPGFGEQVADWLGFGKATEEPVLDRRAFEEAAQAIRRALPGRRGQLEIKVRISDQGSVLSASVGGLALGAEGIGRVRAALIGRKLFDLRRSADHGMTLSIPAIILS